MCLVEGRESDSSNNHLPDAAVVATVQAVTFSIVSGASSGFECPAAARAA